MQSGATSEPRSETAGSRYELLQIIARGGQGDVWRARDIQAGREVALKLLNDSSAQSADSVERLRRENAALMALEGTCAVRVFDGPAQHQGIPCVAMELLDGVDLESRLGELEAKGTRLSFSEVTQVLEPVVQTLHKAHGLGIVHRDLKPANIFLLKDGGVRLIDFGYARLEFESRMTHFGVIMGSPCYIAPELWLGHANTSSASVDIYSMAVLTYRMLGGHPPFETQSLVEMRELATHGERPSLHRLRPDLSEAVDDWVKKALAVEPRDRYDSVRALWEALCEAVEQPKPSSWSIIPRAVAASLHPKRVADALRRAGAVLWGRPWRESDPDIASSLPTPVGPVGAAKAPRFKPPLPPQRPPQRLPDEAPDSEPMPISVIPLSVGPRSSKRAPVVLAHAAAAQGVRERHKKKKKPRRRRATKQTRKARQGRRRARGGGR